MNSLNNALEHAISSKRVPSWLLTPSASIRQICDALGTPPGTTVGTLIHILELPGNFMPGQRLSTGSERNDVGDSHQADVLCVGLDASLWKFWTADENPWGSGVVRPSGELAAGASLALQSTNIYLNGDHYVLAICAASTQTARVNVMWQDPDGNWNINIVAAGGVALPKRANLVPYFGEIGSFLAVDVTGTLSLYQNPSDVMNGGAKWNIIPISEHTFAPPGAPLAVDNRLVTGMDEGGLSDLGPVSVFIVDNEGAMWVFQSEDDGASWSGTRMPVGDNISFPPGTRIATGYQAGGRKNIFGGTEDIGYCQLDVFAIDSNGVMHMWWESQGSAWTATGLPQLGSFPPGGPVTTGYQVYEILGGNLPYGAQLDVFAVDTGGILRRGWVYKSGTWNFDALPSSIALPTGASLATGYQSIDSKGAPHQLDVFAVGLDGRIVVFWQNDSPWNCELMPGSDGPVPGQFM